jgi:hypothetical protein
VLFVYLSLKGINFIGHYRGRCEVGTETLYVMQIDLVFLEIIKKLVKAQ